MDREGILEGIGRQLKQRHDFCLIIGDRTVSARAFQEPNTVHATFTLGHSCHAVECTLESLKVLRENDIPLAWVRSIFIMFGGACAETKNDVSENGFWLIDAADIAKRIIPTVDVYVAAVPPRWKRGSNFEDENTRYMRLVKEINQDLKTVTDLSKHATFIADWAEGWFGRDGKLNPLFFDKGEGHTPRTGAAFQKLRSAIAKSMEGKDNQAVFHKYSEEMVPQPTDEATPVEMENNHVEDTKTIDAIMSTVPDEDIEALMQKPSIFFSGKPTDKTINEPPKKKTALASPPERTPPPPNRVIINRTCPNTKDTTEPIPEAGSAKTLKRRDQRMEEQAAQADRLIVLGGGQQGTSGTATRRPTCMICMSEGHWGSECTLRNKPFCPFCGAEEHILSECPFQRK